MFTRMQHSSAACILYVYTQRSTAVLQCLDSSYVLVFIAISFRFCFKSVSAQEEFEAAVAPLSRTITGFEEVSCASTHRIIQTVYNLILQVCACKGSECSNGYCLLLLHTASLQNIPAHCLSNAKLTMHKFICIYVVICVHTNKY
jgi:hypothetical protein